MTNYLVRRHPFSDMRTTMDRLFDEGFSRPWRLISSTEYNAGFPVELSESEGDIEVRAALPGIRPEEVEITVANDVLSIKADHKAETEESKREYYRKEIRYGAFHRAFNLPVSVDADKAEARYENGMLHLRLPKAEALRPKQIKVTAHEPLAAGTSNGTN
jgi:HSP20 family protein